MPPYLGTELAGAVLKRAVWKEPSHVTVVVIATMEEFFPRQPSYSTQPAKITLHHQFRPLTEIKDHARRLHMLPPFSEMTEQQRWGYPSKRRRPEGIRHDIG